MIDVLVRDKDMPHIHPVIACVFDLGQNGISAAVHHEVLSVIVYNETGVVALCYKCIACSEHCEFHIMFSFVGNDGWDAAHGCSYLVALMLLTRL